LLVSVNEPLTAVSQVRSTACARAARSPPRTAAEADNDTGFNELENLFRFLPSDMFSSHNLNKQI
jgi:hypothetical protein